MDRLPRGFRRMAVPTPYATGELTGRLGRPFFEVPIQLWIVATARHIGDPRLAD
jgi:hypothetical protein